MTSAAAKIKWWWPPRSSPNWNTPRFLASGDTTRLALDLSNLTDKPQTLQVHLTASGLVTLSEGQLPPVQLAPGARSTLFIPVSALAGFGDGQVNATISGLSLPGETFAPLQNSGKSACVRRTRHRPSTAVQCCSQVKAGSRRRRRARAFAPQTLQGQLLLSGKPPLNLARYIRRAESLSLRLP